MSSLNHEHKEIGCALNRLIDILKKDDFCEHYGCLLYAHYLLQEEMLFNITPPMRPHN